MTPVLKRVGALVLALSTILPGCKSQGEGASKEIRIQGGGASFPAPLYTTWIRGFHEKHPEVKIDYQSVGSGSGVKGVIDGTFDFGASDAAMSEEEVKRVKRGVQLLPMTAGSVVLSYNVPGADGLKLSRAAYAGIFLGTVERWNDPLIAAANPDAKLPDEPINVIVRADSSGTTFVFTKHMSAISEAFAESPGAHKMPSWPVGTRAKGNEGVTASIKTTPGSIGYVEYGYATSQKLQTASLENAAGKFVAPSTTSGQAALAVTQLPDDMNVSNSDPQGEDAYPIVTYTWLILYRSYPDPAELQALTDFVRYGLTTGQERAEELGYIPLPETVRKKVEQALAGLSAQGQS